MLRCAAMNGSPIILLIAIFSAVALPLVLLLAATVLL
jgi:hypothetical protein